MKVTGDAPGWIYKHRANLVNTNQIRISGGMTVTWANDEELHARNEKSFLLNTEQMTWVNESGMG